MSAAIIPFRRPALPPVQLRATDALLFRVKTPTQTVCGLTWAQAERIIKGCAKRGIPVELRAY